MLACAHSFSKPCSLDMRTGGSVRHLPGPRRARRPRERGRSGIRVLCVTNSCSWDAHSEPASRVEPSLSSQRSTHSETGPSTDQFRLALPAPPAAAQEPHGGEGACFTKLRKGAGQAAGMGPRPPGPLLPGHSNTGAEGHAPAITHPTTAKVLRVSPGVHLQVFISVSLSPPLGLSLSICEWLDHSACCRF